MNFAQPFQDYEILDRLGAGAMGTVFKARHKKLGRIVALKVLKPSLARDERYVDRLRREARIVASLNHPNVVAGYDLGEEGGYHFFVMELAEGKSLRSLLAEWGMFAEQQVLSVGTQVAAALDHAFQRGVIHRDVKPGNILIDDKGNVKLTDMGLAKGPTDLTLTKDGATVGTPQYISPEQARNPQEVDIRTDLYSLGATLYHMATGQPPFRAETLAELITKVLSETVRSPQELNPELSAGLSLVIRKLLAKDLAVRYQTPRELLDDLERVGRNEAPVVDAGSLDEGERAPVRRSLLRGSVALGLLLAVLVGAWVGSQVRGNGNSDVPADTAFQEHLDRDLAVIPTMGERWRRLKMAGATAPAAASAFLREREAQVLVKMQLALDDAVQSFLVERRDVDVVAWLTDPNRWPSAAHFAQLKLGPKLHSVVGLAREELPAPIDRSRIDELGKLVEEQIARRDEGLLRDFDSYAAGALSTEIQELLNGSDFAAAEKRWNDGLLAFTEGKAAGLLDRLPEPLRQELRARYTVVKEAGMEQVQRLEQEAAAALQTEVAEGLGHLQERQRAGAPWSALSQGLATMRAGLRLHPSQGRFRLEGNPWPQVEQQLRAFEQRLDLMRTEAEPVRLDWYLDMAYRTLCAGGTAEAAELLRVVTIEEPNALLDLQRHRAAIEAAAEVTAAILAGLERSGELHGFWRAEALRSVPLRIQRTGDQLRLYVEPPGAPSREAMLTEFLLPDLIQRAMRGVGLRDLPADRRARGELVLAMAADDLVGLSDRVREVGDEFLLGEVWPRIRRLRNEPRDQAGPSRREFWLRVEQAWHTAQRDKVLAPLDAALAAFQGRFRDTDLSPEDRRELALVLGWQRGERARQDLEARLKKDAPVGASIEVVGGEAALLSSVRLRLDALKPLVREGWSASDEPVAMVRSGPAPIDEWGKKRLELASGMAAGTGSCACTAVLWLPPADGDRIWVLEFRGVAVLLVMAQDGSIGAALLGPEEVQRPEALQRGVRKGLAPFTGASKLPRAVPGGLHRIGIEVGSVTGRKAKVRVLFEDTELLFEQREVDSRTAPALWILPSQQVGVTAVEFRSGVP